jgi:DNA-binding IclR family transcriptional regulator
MLTALAEPGTAEDVAARSGLPLFRVRGGLREMVEAGLVDLKSGTYSPTQRGLALVPA